MGAKRIKVLHIGKFYPPRMGGIETHLEALCGELSKSVDLEVIVANHSRGTQREVLDGVPVVRVHTMATVSSAPICPSMSRHIRAAKADIVHIHVPNPTAILSYFASGHKGRLIVSYHSDVFKQKILGPLFQPFQNLALGRCAAIIASSPDYIETSPVLQRFSERCHVIPYGVSVKHFMRPDADAVARQSERYGSRLILSVGRLVYYKGFEYLIRAMAKVNGKLLLVGKGPLRPALEKLAGECGVSDRVLFLGDLDDEQLRCCYHAADLFVLPSIARSEAFGIVQIEAMAAGKPIINTQLDSGVPFVSLHEITGLTVPPMDSEALGSAINLLLNNRDLRQRYGAAAQLRSRTEFNLESMTSRTLRLYRRVLSEPRGTIVRSVDRTNRESGESLPIT